MTGRMPPAGYTSYLGGFGDTRYRCDCQWSTDDQAEMEAHIEQRHEPRPDVAESRERQLLVSEFAKALSEARYQGYQAGLEHAASELEQSKEQWTSFDAREALTDMAEEIRASAESMAVATNRAEDGGWWS